MDLMVTVTAPTGEAHRISLAQEGAKQWQDFIEEMQNAGHDSATIVRTVAERIKSTVAPPRDDLVKDLRELTWTLGQKVGQLGLEITQAIGAIADKHAKPPGLPAATILDRQFASSAGRPVNRRR